MLICGALTTFMEDGSQIYDASGTTTIVGDQRGPSSSSFVCDDWNNGCSTTCAPQCSVLENTNGVLVGHHLAGPSLTFEVHTYIPLIRSLTLLINKINLHPSYLAMTNNIAWFNFLAATAAAATVNLPHLIILQPINIIVPADHDIDYSSAIHGQRSSSIAAP